MKWTRLSRLYLSKLKTNALESELFVLKISTVDADITYDEYSMNGDET